MMNCIEVNTAQGRQLICVDNLRRIYVGPFETNGEDVIFIWFHEGIALRLEGNAAQMYHDIKLQLDSIALADRLTNYPVCNCRNSFDFSHIDLSEVNK